MQKRLACGQLNKRTWPSPQSNPTFGSTITTTTRRKPNHVVLVSSYYFHAMTLKAFSIDTSLRGRTVIKASSSSSLSSYFLRH